MMMFEVPNLPAQERLRGEVSTATKKARADWTKLLEERTQLEQLQPETAGVQ
jgi:hypothetical protein